MMKSYELFHLQTKQQIGVLMLPEEMTVSPSKDIPTFVELRDQHGAWFAVMRDVEVKSLPQMAQDSGARRAGK